MSGSYAFITQDEGITPLFQYVMERDFSQSGCKGRQFCWQSNNCIRFSSHSVMIFEERRRLALAKYANGEIMVKKLGICEGVSDLFATFVNEPRARAARRHEEG